LFITVNPYFKALELTYSLLNKYFAKEYTVQYKLSVQITENKFQQCSVDLHRIWRGIFHSFALHFKREKLPAFLLIFPNAAGQHFKKQAARKQQLRK
jgi:hypothetical protein